MFEEAKDDELEDIIEEEIEDESEDEPIEDEVANGDMLLTSQEEREERKERRHELLTLKTQMLTIKEKLQMKTMRIEEIKDTLKRSQLLTRGSVKDVTGGPGAFQEGDVIDEVVKEYENQEVDEEEGAGEAEDEDSAGELPAEENGEEDDEEDDGMDNGLEEVDPQVLKLQERIKFLRHRCVSSLGNQIFEKAYSTYQQVS